MASDWQCDYFSIKDRNVQLLEKEHFSDCSFLVVYETESKNFKAHKLLLANASPVFEKMYFGSLPENTEHEPTKIYGIKPKTFEAMLKYIYTDAIDPEQWEDIADLFGAAKKYMLRQLEKFCTEYLLNEMSSSNVLHIYEFAQFYEEEKLLEAALKIMRAETIEVINSTNFLTIDISTMLILLEQDYLQATEEELFQALESLAEAQGVIKKTLKEEDKSEEEIEEISDEKKAEMVEKFRKAVKKIQFYLMTAEQFASGPAKSELLLPEEIASIMICLVRSSNLKTFYPKDFQQDVRPSKNLPRVFLDIKADDSLIGRIVIELRSDIVPKAVDLFLTFFQDKESCGFKGSEIEYSGSNFILIRAINYATGLQLPKVKLDHENFVQKHNGFGTVSLYTFEDGANYNVSNQFCIEYRKLAEFNNSDVIVGKVTEGMDVVEIIMSNKPDWKCLHEPKKLITVKRFGVLEASYND